MVFAARYGVLPFTHPSAHTFSQTTLLKIIGGKHMVDKDCIRVLGRPPFHDTNLTVSGECDSAVPLRHSGGDHPHAIMAGISLHPFWLGSLSLSCPLPPLSKSARFASSPEQET